MRDVSAKSKKTQEERERQRIIAERKKARSESIKKQNMEYVASAEEAAPADAGPIDLHKFIKDLAKINADLENVELTPEPLRPEAEYMPNIQVLYVEDCFGEETVSHLTNLSRTSSIRKKSSCSCA
jgi:hypothetical protein